MLGKKLKQAQFCAVVTLIVSVSICSRLQAAPNRASLAEIYIPKFEKMLTDNIASFWYSKSLDRINGGYVEFFNEDWTQVAAGESSYMGAGPNLKLMNTHLHLLEAMTTFYRASKLPLARERLLELINILSNTVVRKNIGACTDKYDRDWTASSQESPTATTSRTSGF